MIFNHGNQGYLFRTKNTCKWGCWYKHPSRRVICIYMYMYTFYLHIHIYIYMCMYMYMYIHYIIYIYLKLKTEEDACIWHYLHRHQIDTAPDCPINRGSNPPSPRTLGALDGGGEISPVELRNFHGLVENMGVHPKSQNPTSCRAP